MDTVPPVESEAALRKRAAADPAAEILAVAAHVRSDLRIRCGTTASFPSDVIPGPDPGIRAASACWIAGSGPAVTGNGSVVLHRTVGGAPPSSDHGWLYGEDGLPAGRGDCALADIEPALKE